MENSYKRKVSEISMTYNLEPELRDIYTEGNEDSRILEIFLKSNNITDVSIRQIDSIDFSELDMNLKSNRDKVISLSKVLSELNNEQIKFVSCVADMDFEIISQSEPANPFLMWTDFANLEMYLFNDKVLGKFLKIGLGNFPYNFKETTQMLVPVLIYNYSIRYARTCLDSSYQLVSLDKVIKIRNAQLSYDLNEVLTKFLLKNNIVNRKEEFESLIEKVHTLQENSSDFRMFIHGKDFIELLFLFIKKVKNTYTFNDKSFTRAIFSSIEIEDLKNYPLFKNILSKYKVKASA